MPVSQSRATSRQKMTYTDTATQYPREWLHLNVQVQSNAAVEIKKKGLASAKASISYVTSPRECIAFSSVQKLIALRNMMALDSPFPPLQINITIYRHTKESNRYLHAGVTSP